MFLLSVLKKFVFVFYGVVLFFVSHIFVDAGEATDVQPNILWITCEDSGRHLGCYDFPVAVTPNLDKLAAKGTRYRHAWSNSPVCSAARTTIITGCYPASLGAEHHRSIVKLPESFYLFPQYLRNAGYYCTNNSKTDYNIQSKISGWWDDSNQNAHWKNRKANQPFFAVFNLTMTHESQMRNEYKLSRDPMSVPIPPYHPDTPESRQNWTQYHERITQMDRRCGELLKELEEMELSEDTIIFFFSDHGSGLPRNKQTPLDSGLGVPLIIYFPEKFRHLAPNDYKPGEFSSRLISFVDLAPTILSLAGITIPQHMQGKAFAGKFETTKRNYVYGFRSRIDERSELTRSICDGRFVYARNFHPEIIYGALGAYAQQTPTTRIWREQYHKGKLSEHQKFFWELKPTEELYDLETDPFEMNNLADSEQYQSKRRELQTALRNHQRAIRDVQIFPEVMMLKRSETTTPYHLGYTLKQNDYDKILHAAELATDRKTSIKEITAMSDDSEESVRYWSSIGLLLRLADTAGSDGTEPTALTGKLYSEIYSVVLKLQKDSDPNVKIVASEIMGRFGTESDIDIAFKNLFMLIPSGKDADTPLTQTVLAAIDNFAFRLTQTQYQNELDTLSAITFSTRNTATAKSLVNSIFQQISKTVKFQ
ncbi:MAG: sulfatase [Planctomycetaceae bacterium]|jgi:uncharacterized sulfatase|nr:sulfatase [Planctomycetaceae bacterium]